jgi:hypothetical protein
MNDIRIVVTPEPSSYDHQLTITPDGRWNCSCMKWGDKHLGPLTGDYCITQGITEQIVCKWHASHANAIIIEFRI